MVTNQEGTMTTTRKGTTYYPSYDHARAVSRSIAGSRVVAYELGWAVQLRISGPYYSR